MGLTRDEALKIMGLEEGCTTKEVRDRFKKLALKWHPDKNLNNPDDAQRKFQAISAAYTKLMSTEEENDDIPTDTLREMFAEIWQSHGGRRRATFGEPHLFCDCDSCRADWEDIDLEDFIGSDSDPDDDFYYDDTLYADDLLKQFGDKLYRRFNGPGRNEKKTKNSWTGAGYRDKVTVEEALRHADELLKAEEKEKKEAEKKKKRNKKKKESRKRRKTKQQDDDGCVEDTQPERGEEGDGEEPAEVECDTTKEEEKSEEVVNTVDPELNKVSPEETENSNRPDSRQEAAVNVTTGVADGGEKPEQDENSLPSEDELDLSSAFVLHAKASAAARAPKPKEKTPATAGKNTEPQKKSTKVQKSNPKPDSGQNASQAVPQTVRQTYKPDHHVKNPRTFNKGPGRSKVVMGVNGSAPVISASNGYEAPVVMEEEDDLSSVDMSQAQLYEANIPQSKLLAGEGNRAAKVGNLEEAVYKYSEAIELYPFDHRYFGNRSFCYDYLQEYSKALSDANSALKIDITWAKGFYRRGRGLAGLKRYEAAVAAFSRALDLNPQYAEALEQLEMVQLEQLKSMGFPVEASKVALAEYHTVAAAVDAMVNKSGGGGGTKKQRAANSSSSADNYTPVYNHSGFEIPPRMMPQTAPPENCALWVGNINSRSITQHIITDLFQRHGLVSSVRMLYERRCAFVNYTRPESAATALKKLQGHMIAGCSLVLRYPDNTAPPPPPVFNQRSKKPSAVEECHFWRSTGCSYGDQCRYLHLPESRGVDAASEGANSPSQ